MTTKTLIDILLVAALAAAALWTVMTARLMRAVVALAVTSVLVTVLMFRLASPIAGVFELSVCAGLIPAILITTIGLTQRLSPEALAERKKEKLRRYWPLLVLVAAAAVAFAVAAQRHVKLPLEFAPTAAVEQKDVRQSLWILRRVDLLGQMVVLLGGAFAVVVLVRGDKKDNA